MPTTLNTLTGKVAVVPQSLVDHAVLGKYLKVVPDGTKPLASKLFKPGTVEEFDAAHKNAKPLAEAEPDATKDKDK